MTRPPSVKLPALFYWRIQLMLSKRELASHSNVSIRTIGLLEHGSRAMPNTVDCLAQALDVKPSDLMQPPPDFGDRIVTPPALTWRYRQPAQT